MWNKIYTAVLGVSFVLTAGLIFYSYTWLQSVGAPKNVAENYDYHSNISWMFLWISSLILLVLANVVLWTTRNAWAMWATFLYFALFVLIQTFWLGESFSRYKQENGLGEGGVSSGVFLGIILSGLAAAIVFFNQFLVKRMRDKMFVQAQPVTENQAELKTNLNENHN